MKITNSSIPEIIGSDFWIDGKKNCINLGKFRLFFADKILASYPTNEVERFKVLDLNEQRVGTKSMLGTIGGAVVGGVLTGGAGAIVGGMATGNKKTKKFSTTDIALEFSDGNWIVVRYDDTSDETTLGRINNSAINNMKKMFSHKSTNPFE